MACSGCGKNKIGLSASKAFVLGQDDQNPPIYALVKQNGVLPGVPVGQYRWVTGTGVSAAVEEGLIIESGVTPNRAHIAPQEVWCVKEGASERCFRTLALAERYGRRSGSEPEHRILR